MQRKVDQLLIFPQLPFSSLCLNNNATESWCSKSCIKITFLLANFHLYTCCCYAAWQLPFNLSPLLSPQLLWDQSTWGKNGRDQSVLHYISSGGRQNLRGLQFIIFLLVLHLLYSTRQGGKGDETLIVMSKQSDCQCCLHAASLLVIIVIGKYF